MHIIERKHHHFFFDRTLAPAATVPAGEVVAFQTIDACMDEVRTLADWHVHRQGRRPPGNPITGPVFVRGAKPGGTLVVDVLSVKLDEVGFQLIGPDRAVIRDEVREWDCYPVRIEGEHLVLPRGLRLPIDPVIGTIGNASAGERFNHPTPLGGNLDVPQVRTGSRVYIPVEVEGALFSLGDIHARQGDGEVVGAPEIGAVVTVRLSVLDHRHSDWLMIEDAQNWCTVTSGANEAEALRTGVLESARFIQRTYGVSFNDALILLTMTVQLHCSRTGKWGNLLPAVCTTFPKRAIQEATANYSA